MIDTEKFKQIIKSKNLPDIIKSSKEIYKYLLFENNYNKFYYDVFPDLDYLQILEIPVLYIIYCKLLKYNNKKSKLNEVLSDYKNLNLIQNSIELEFSFTSNILLLEAYIEKNNDRCELALKKLEKSLNELTNNYDYNLLSEIHYEMGSIYFTIFRTSEALVSYKKSEYYVLNENFSNNEVLLRIKINIANCILMKNKINACFDELKKIELFIEQNNLINHPYLIFYYDILNKVLFYKNKKNLLFENINKSLILFKKTNKLPSFMPYINIASQLIYMNELEKSKSFIKKLEEKFNVIEPPKKIRLFLYTLNALLSEKTNDMKSFKIWIKEIELVIKNDYETDHGLSIFYSYSMLKVDNIVEAEIVSKKNIDFILEKDCELIKQKSEILKIDIDYRKGNKPQAIFQLKEKLFLFQKEWNVGIFLESSKLILNMINQIYLDSLNKKTFFDLNYLAEIISYIPKKDKFNNFFTEKELEILMLIEKKMNNQEIANKLFISLSTVKTHISNITKKLGVNNRTDAVIKAKEYLIF